MHTDKNEKRFKLHRYRCKLIRLIKDTLLGSKTGANFLDEIHMNTDKIEYRCKMQNAKIKYRCNLLRLKTGSKW